MDIEFRDKTFELMLNISDAGFDALAKQRLKTFMGRPNEEIKDELLGLIDDIVYYAWSSSFELMVLDQVWKEIGGSQKELEERNKTNLDTPENKLKYKWMR